jgi:hydroxymethylglutaryl-CoA reductase
MEERRAEIRRSFAVEQDEWDAISGLPLCRELSDVMVEAAVGCMPVPLGVATGFLIDGVEVAIPLAVEEPSVISAATFAARLTRRDGGFTSWASEPLMTAQVFLENVDGQGLLKLHDCGPRIRSVLSGELASLERRGGGYRRTEATRLPQSGIVRVDIVVDVRDAMGANRLNSVAERVRPELEKASGGRAVMAILSNEARERLAGARFSIPAERLAIGLPPGMDAPEAARRIAAASTIAQEDPSRAVTHNKGIMNGIASLALATMNDTRAIEAAAHAWACRSGRYRGLSTFTADGGVLQGTLELPLPFATVGGSVDFHPASRASLAILGRPDAPRLARIAAALGLAQNLAALLALVTHGIPHGHMRYHAARLAWRAGARGSEVRQVADVLAEAERTDIGAARRALDGLRGRGS